MQSNRYQRNANGAGLTDPQITRQFRDVKHFHGDQVAASYHIVVRRGARAPGKFRDSLVGFLLSFELFGLDRSL